MPKRGENNSRRLVRYLGEVETGKTCLEIAEGAGIDLSRVRTIVYTLMSRGFVMRCDEVGVSGRRYITTELGRRYVRDALVSGTVLTRLRDASYRYIKKLGTPRFKSFIAAYDVDNLRDLDVQHADEVIRKLRTDGNKT